jgi:AraC-like DNA-binding protein
MPQEDLSPRAEGPAAELARRLLPHAPYDGSFELPFPGVQVFRASRPQGERVHGIHRAAICLVAQGAKRVFLGPEAYEYDAAHMLVASVDLPVSAQVTRASPSEPLLGLKLELDPQRIADLLLRVYPHGLPQDPRRRAVCVTRADADILDAAARLVALAARPEEAELLAPLVLEEILIRLLRGPMGIRVAQIGREESHLHKISRAVSWVQAHFDQPLNVEELAGMLHMSASAFHRQFKSVTSLSPLQYQKLLRLQEARRLMLSRMMDAGAAARQVGYLSASQFSREYGRYFGSPPSRDVARLREGCPLEGGAEG